MRKKIVSCKQARQLRREGIAITKIAVSLGVAKSSVYEWTKDMTRPEKFTPKYKSKQKKKRIAAVEKARKQNKGRPPRKERVVSGDGRWMIPVPVGYTGKTYIKGLYVYEHRYLIEQKIGRLLDSKEVVHHINEDKLDNSLENLELISKKVHDAQHAVERTHWRVQFKCPTCGKVASKERRHTYLGQKNKKKHMIFCSSRCGGRFRGMHLSDVAMQRRWDGNVLKEYQASRG